MAATYRLSLLLVALVASACGGDDPTATAIPATSNSSSTPSASTTAPTTTSTATTTMPTTTTTATTTSTSGERPTPVLDPPCEVLESSVPGNPSPQPPEFSAARLEAAVGEWKSAWAVDEGTVWVSLPDAAADGVPADEGPIRHLSASEDDCWVVDIAVIGDSPYAITCRKATHDDCWTHRLHRDTGATVASAYVRGHDLLAGNAAVVVLGESRITAFDLDLTERWSVAEPWAGRSVATDGAVWVNQSEGRRIDLDTGEDLPPFAPEDRVGPVDGEVVAAAEFHVEVGTAEPFVRLLDDELEEIARWNYANASPASATPLSNGGWVAQVGFPFDGQKLGRFDFYTGEFTPVVDFSGEPVSRSGSTMLELIDVIDGRLWFWWDRSIWSIPFA